MLASTVAAWMPKRSAHEATARHVSEKSLDKDTCFSLTERLLDPELLHLVRERAHRHLQETRGFGLIAAGAA